MGRAIRALRKYRRTINPNSIEGLNCWYDANVGLYSAASGGTLVTTNGASVFRWEDQSGNGYHLTKNLASAPTLVTNALNGLRGVSFNGTNQMLEETTNTAGNLASLQLYVFIVYKFTTYSATANVNTIARDGGYASATAGRWQLGRYDMSAWGGGQGQLYAMSHTNGVWEFGKPTWTSVAYNLLMYAFPRTQTRGFNSIVSINDVNQATLACSDNGAPGGSTPSLHRLTVGARCSGATYSPVNYCNCVINEIAVYTRPFFFNKYEYEGLTKYFRKKWNV